MQVRVQGSSRALPSSWKLAGLSLQGAVFVCHIPVPWKPQEEQQWVNVCTIAFKSKQCFGKQMSEVETVWILIGKWNHSFPLSLGAGIPLFVLTWPLTDYRSYKHPWLLNGRRVMMTWISPDSEGHSTGNPGHYSLNSFSGKLSGWVNYSLASSGDFILFSIRFKKWPQALTTGCYFIKEHTEFSFQVKC